jgi:hypothetical protein
MPRFTVTVTESVGHPSGTEPVKSAEVFKLGLDSFDPVMFCTALLAKKPGRPARKTATPAK